MYGRGDEWTVKMERERQERRDKMERVWERSEEKRQDGKSKTRKVEGKSGEERTGEEKRDVGRL